MEKSDLGPNFLEEIFNISSRFNLSQTDVFDFVVRLANNQNNTTEADNFRLNSEYRPLVMGLYIFIIILGAIGNIFILVTFFTNKVSLTNFEI